MQRLIPSPQSPASRLLLLAAAALWSAFLLLLPGRSAAQAFKLTVDVSSLEGVELTPANAFGYRILNTSGSSPDVRITGTVRFRNSSLRLSYAFNTRLEPGVNTISAERAGMPQWTASDEALRRLFITYSRLPQGTYEYCVEVLYKGNGHEQAAPEPSEGCVYHTVEDLFAINLVDPEDKALLHERYPAFSWAVNYPFASELTYRIRVAEQKAGQNPANAISRNNPMWQQTDVPATTATYPLAGRPLEVGQPYVWTVDAYYHGLLLGGAENWRFTIVEDSLQEALPDESSYIDINADDGSNRYYAVGQMKLKYAENDFLQNELKIKIRRGGSTAGKDEIVWPVNRGDNFNTYDLTALNLRHKEEIEIVVEFAQVKSNPVTQVIKFKYVNPTLVK